METQSAKKNSSSALLRAVLRSGNVTVLGKVVLKDPQEAFASPLTLEAHPLRVRGRRANIQGLSTEQFGSVVARGAQQPEGIR